MLSSRLPPGSSMPPSAREGTENPALSSQRPKTWTDYFSYYYWPPGTLHKLPMSLV